MSLGCCVPHKASFTWAAEFHRGQLQMLPLPSDSSCRGLYSMRLRMNKISLFLTCQIRLRSAFGGNKVLLCSLLSLQKLLSYESCVCIPSYHLQFFLSAPLYVHPRNLLRLKDLGWDGKEKVLESYVDFVLDLGSGVSNGNRKLD